MASFLSSSAKRKIPQKSLLGQVGQSMAEYTVVVVAFVGGLLVVNDQACSDNASGNCIELLLTVMHDNYDGYSSSISAVQEYATDYAVADGGEGWGNGVGDGDGSGSTGGGDSGGETADGLTQVTSLTSADGSDIYGEYNAATGDVVKDGLIVGTYSEDTGLFTEEDGTETSGLITETVVKDEDGNELERIALTDCAGGVLGFAYQSQVDGQYYNTIQLGELDIGDSCPVDAVKVVDTDYQDMAGRIVDGFFYALTLTDKLADEAARPDGEVIFFAGFCQVVPNGWDDLLFDEDGEPVDMDDEDAVYEAQVLLLLPEDPADSPVIGYQAPLTGCDSNRTISEP